MIAYSKTLSLCFVFAVAAAAMIGGKAEADGPRLNGSGPITIKFKSSEATPGYLIYEYAHATMRNGTTLDSDELKLIPFTGGASRSKGSLKEIDANGHVKATLVDVIGTTSYTDVATSDNGVYDPVNNTITLTGDVTIVVYNPSVDGPITQTGTTAVIYLAPPGESSNPDYPKIDMQQGHTVVSPKQK